MGRKDDPDLAPDAALAVEDTPERAAEQLAHLGGDRDEIDDFDPSDLDDGSVLPDDYDPLNPAPAASPSDEDTEDEVTEDEEDDDAETDKLPAEDAEDAEEDADEADADVDSEDEEPADEKPAQKGIPKHRFDEVNERRKAAEARAEQLQAQIDAGKDPEEQEVPYDIRAGEKEYMDLVLDGDVDAALDKREEIDAAKEAKWKSDAKHETKEDIEVSADNTELLALSREAQEMFDVFDPDSENYDQAKLNKVMVFMRGYENSDPDMTRADAFVYALSDVAEMYGLQIPGDDPEPEPEPKKAGKKDDSARKAKLKEKAHTPVSGDGTPSADTGAVVPNIEDMTDEEIDALPPKVLARMRGDII